MSAGQAGGYGAAFALMQGMNLIPAATAVTAPDWPRDAGKGSRVVILGAGIAGLTAAYEMGKAGFQCTILEARERPGGRNWTIRNGSRVTFTDGTEQTAAWQPDSYFNAGPGRIPSIHRNILNYCHELGVDLEVQVNTTRSSLLVNPTSFGGKAIEQRQAINDTRGHVSELLAKCVNQHALDQELTGEDRERMLSFLRTYGDLSNEYSYKGSERAGASRLGGAGNVTEELRPPLDMHTLLDADFWRGMLFEEGLDYQATMFQPVGGMDRIAYAFTKRLGRIVQYRAVVSKMGKTARGVRIEYEQSGAKKAIEADFCICTLPAPVLRGMDGDFAPRIRTAINATFFSDAYKIGWESKRFWERSYNIYGGISFLSNHPITLVWYPSAKLFSDSGIVISGYAPETGSPFGGLPDLRAKLKASRDAMELLHPGHSSELAHPVYVNWGKMPYSLGGWMSGGGGGGRSSARAQPVNYYDGPYQEFIRPDDRYYYAGDHISHLSAWQEGAVLSAHYAIRLICDRIRNEKTAGASKA